MTDPLNDLREDYPGAALTEAEVAADPVVQVNAWLADAVAAGEPLANAMTLATVDDRARPSARIVLLKGLDGRGATFFTSYGSRKGTELAENPACAAVLYWPRLHRQVRLEGRAEKISAAESDAYFATRPPASNASAIASPQSQVIPDRKSLETRRAALLSQGRLDRPATWGGFRITL
ncbi:MAG TPA: pyridoxal 5'-phosphate synthase, partial [Kofleriaceae bacterium]|nr:pyridoxal 5'-phosphate synthase [Kofleriaceae bacterium]